MESLRPLVEEWLSLDQNAETRQEIQKLWSEGDIVELEKRMRKRIEFGTAGLRGKMQAGWSRMNDLIIIQASQGLCAYVLAHVENARERGIVVGHDHRHHSKHWADLTASVFLANGVKAYLYRDLVHTPMVPFGVKALRAACGVMITASHNPKDDNGYKVYWENGVQIISPHDEGISDSIKANLTPKTWDTSLVDSSSFCIDPTEDMREAYFAELAKLSLYKSPNAQSIVKFVNTSMHGVSHPFVTRGFELFGLPPFVAVEEQRHPDPDFPTVPFPNPEEKGALDLAISTAEREGAQYVLAQDPDSDRFAAAEKGPSGKWIVFTGDQLGALFASRELAIYKQSGKPLEKLAMVASTVSSKMIEAMAHAEGFKFAECLTGFKFIGNTALTLVEQGFEVPFGYEEAIGYMFGPQIRDKDGVAATVSFAELVTSLQREGETASSYISKLYERYGYFKTSNSYFICDDPSKINEIFTRIRSYPTASSSNTAASPTHIDATYPSEIAGLKVTSIVDLTTGYDSTNAPSFKPRLPLSSGHMIQFRAGNDEVKIVLTTRTSGTEPKIKYYLEGSGRDRAKVEFILPKVVEELGREWMEAEKHSLGRPSA
ncbi:phosphohexose mutase family protein [Pleurotus pulmonarius]|nr:Phosphoglucomutase-3 [Pleurotus pulmonarius]